jgi:hypothetical protein
MRYEVFDGSDAEALEEHLPGGPHSLDELAAFIQQPDPSLPVLHY